MGDTKVYIVEHSVVDPFTKTMKTRLRNISLRYYLDVTETCDFTANNHTAVGDDTFGASTSSSSSSSSNGTLARSSARITSSMFSIGGMVERYGLRRFKKNQDKARNGLLQVLNRIDDNGSGGSKTGRNEDTKGTVVDGVNRFPRLSAQLTALGQVRTASCEAE